MAIHEHRHIKIKPDDQIILSAKAIPGNEGSVSGIINHLLKAGAKVAYQDYPDIHGSRYTYPFLSPSQMRVNINPQM
jgi:ribonuclease J